MFVKQVTEVVCEQGDGAQSYRYLSIAQTSVDFPLLKGSLAIIANVSGRTTAIRFCKHVLIELTVQKPRFESQEPVRVCLLLVATNVEAERSHKLKGKNAVSLSPLNVKVFILVICLSNPAQIVSIVRVCVVELSKNKLITRR